MGSRKTNAISELFNDMEAIKKPLFSFSFSFAIKAQLIQLIVLSFYDGDHFYLLILCFLQKKNKIKNSFIIYNIIFESYIF